MMRRAHDVHQKALTWSYMTRDNKGDLALGSDHVCANEMAIPFVVMACGRIRARCVWLYSCSMSAQRDEVAKETTSKNEPLGACARPSKNHSKRKHWRSSVDHRLISDGGRRPRKVCASLRSRDKLSMELIHVADFAAAAGQQQLALGVCRACKAG